MQTELSPYLVSSLDDIVWVEKASQTGHIWSAFRPQEGWERGVLDKVRDRGGAEGWGNVHSLTPEGVDAARSYILSYELDPEILVGSGVSFSVKGAQSAPWVPEHTVVVVPRDRMYLGTVHQVSPIQVAVVVHNASRGIALATASVAQDHPKRVRSQRRG